jgi:fibronectin type 3 domain-containing protein
VLTDTFAPATPVGVTAVASEGAMSLIWDPNKEPDHAGYLVLRASVPGDAPQPLTGTPIPETSYRDTTVTPGQRYAYAVVAVDKSGNASAPSAPVEETAR